MNVLTLVRRIASFLALGVLPLVLSACMVTSEANLVADGEAAAVLPATFHFFTYNDRDGTYARTEDPAMAYTQGAGNAYADAEGSMSVSFVPFGNDGRTYLLSVAAADGSMYGLARFADNIMEIRMILGNDVGAELQAAGAGNLATAEGAIEVSDRATLDLVIGLIAQGKLTTAPLLAYVGDSADAPVPATLVKDGDWYKAG
jgi:hypothetical protein